jgi:glutamine synthetase
MKVILEYIWQDHDCNFRSKTKVMNINEIKLDKLPIWNYDGSSTEQADGSDSEVYIKPISIYKDPFRKNLQNSYLVLCDTWLPNGNPHPDNTREKARKIFENELVSNEKPMFGIEQEFFFTNLETNRPLGFPLLGYPLPQGPYYCGVGAGNCNGRKVAEEILSNALFCDLNVTGLNFEVAPGQCEFQLCDTGIKASDDLIMLRYLMVRTAENYGVGINLHPKPEKGDWNGSGCHTNYSTISMRNEDGIKHIMEAINKLENKHNEHIKIYGIDNDQRLTGLHETASINKFSYGVANRGCSIRIPRFTDRDGKGYLEDRRPASNMDPYLVTSKIVETTVL